MDRLVISLINHKYIENREQKDHIFLKKNLLW